MHKKQRHSSPERTTLNQRWFRLWRRLSNRSSRRPLVLCNEASPNDLSQIYPKQFETPSHNLVFNKSVHPAVLRAAVDMLEPVATASTKSQTVQQGTQLPGQSHQAPRVLVKQRCSGITTLEEWLVSGVTGMSKSPTKTTRAPKLDSLSARSAVSGKDIRVVFSDPNLKITIPK